MPYVLCVLSCLITKAVHSVSTEAIYLITNTLSGEEKRPPESRWTCGIAYLSSCCPYSKPIGPWGDVRDKRTLPNSCWQTISPDRQCETSRSGARAICGLNAKLQLNITLRWRVKENRTESICSSKHPTAANIWHFMASTIHRIFAGLDWSMLHCGLSFCSSCVEVVFK